MLPSVTLLPNMSLMETLPLATFLSNMSPMEVLPSVTFSVQTCHPKWERSLLQKFIIAATEENPTSLKLKVKIKTTDTAEKKSISALVDWSNWGVYWQTLCQEFPLQPCQAHPADPSVQCWWHSQQSWLYNGNHQPNPLLQEPLRENHLCCLWLRQAEADLGPFLPLEA